MNTPNIIYILADDMGYGDLSCFNPESKISTPHLDRLASEGMRFRDAHASSAVCTPSRYSILTGRYNWRSSLKKGVIWGEDGPIIERNRMTVASLLRDNGYHTACIGKWHLGCTWQRRMGDSNEIDFSMPIADGPICNGFDHFFGISASLDMPPYVYIEDDRVVSMPDRIIPERTGKAFLRAGLCAPDFRHEEVLPTLTEKALEYIARRSAFRCPFYLYFSLTAPHTPILPSPEFRGKSGTNAYGDFCLQVDDLMGRVMNLLEEKGLTENTLIIFTSDNGCSPSADFVELEEVGHRPSYIFRGHKADIFEGGHRVPLIVRWPGRVQPGSWCEETVCLSDFLATCSDILGIRLPDNAGEDSISNLPLFSGEAKPVREATVHSSMDGSLAVRKGRWKLEMCPGSGGWSHPEPGPECDGLPRLQLYDLAEDVSECRNVWNEFPKITHQLQAELSEFILSGRSTPGKPQENSGNRTFWPELWWLTNNRSDKM